MCICSGTVGHCAMCMCVCVCEREREREREKERERERKREKERERLASHSQIVWRAKERVTAAADSRQLTVQGDISRRFDDRASSIWVKALWEVPEKVMKFTLSAVQDILPHNANLHLWKSCPLSTATSALIARPYYTP